MVEIMTGLDGPDAVSGAGPVETITGIVNSGIDGSPVAVAGQTAALGLQTLGFITNPVGTLATAGLGWLIEHFSPLNFLLDVTTGDPAAVADAADRFAAAAGRIDDLAVSHINAVNGDLPTYFAAGQVSGSAVEFHGAMSQRATELKTASTACMGTAGFITTAGILVGTVRGLIRDLLAEWAWHTIQRAVAAMAFAPLTFGTSSAGFLTERMISAARLMKDAADELSHLTRQLTEVSTKLAKILSVLEKYLKSPVRQAIVTNVLSESGKGMNTVLDRDVPDRSSGMEVNPLPQPDRSSDTQVNPLPKPWRSSGTLDG